MTREGVTLPSCMHNSQSHPTGKELTEAVISHSDKWMNNKKSALTSHHNYIACVVNIMSLTTREERVHYIHPINSNKIKQDTTFP